MDPTTGELLPELPTQSGVFLGVKLSFVTAERRWVWNHANPETILRDVPLQHQRRKFASIVGFLNWDNMISLEGLQIMQPVFSIIRRITKGVSQKKQWSEIVIITEEENRTLVDALKRASTRANIGINNTRIAGTNIPTRTQGAMCSYCGKPNHTDVQCHVKKRELEKALRDRSPPKRRRDDRSPSRRRSKRSRSRDRRDDRRRDDRRDDGQPPPRTDPSRVKKE